MPEPKLSSLTENQAYSKITDIVEALSLFAEAKEIFKEADETRRRGIIMRKENKPLAEENIRLKEQKKRTEQEIADIKTVGEGRKKKFGEDESTAYALFKVKRADWDKVLEEKRSEYEELIKAKSKELNGIIRAKTKEIEAKELRNATVDKEYNDIKKLFVSVGS